MRVSSDLEKWRLRKGRWKSGDGDKFGLFQIPFKSATLTVLSSGEFDVWEHVSVSLPNRCPNWQEMCFVKGLFWDEEDAVVQFHPPKSLYVNFHPYCLHLWKKQGQQFELPNSILVGPRFTLGAQA